MADSKKFKGSNNPEPGRPDPNPMGDRPRLAVPPAPPDPPPTGPTNLTSKKRPNAGPPGDKPSGR
jgi:hypothetical protein